MKRKLIVITTLVSFILSAIIFVQPAKSEAENLIKPTATPSPRKITKPKTKTNVFLDGGNDSWNTRKKPSRKRTVPKKTTTKNLLPYMEQSNLRKRKHAPNR